MTLLAGLALASFAGAGTALVLNLAPTPYAAVTLRTVGSLGGRAAAFTYDLAKSVVYTRQGNPAWAGQARERRWRRANASG